MGIEPTSSPNDHDTHGHDFDPLKQLDRSTYPPRHGANTVSPGDSRDWADQWASQSVVLPPVPQNPGQDTDAK